MAERRDIVLSNILRDLVQREADDVRRVWKLRMERRMKEAASGE